MLMELRQRFESLPNDELLRCVRIEPGTCDDYRRLAQFHYKGERPGAVTSVFRIVRQGQTAVDRYLQREDRTQLLGVLVRSLPALSCTLRNIATANRYAGLKRRGAAIMLNREVRTMSRVVIDPQWRGLGLAVRLVKHALAHPEPGTRFTEALAAMGHVSPFFERAGMTRYDRPARRDHARLIDALHHIQIDPVMLASPDAIERALNDDARARDFLIMELKRWRGAAHRSDAAEVRPTSLRDLLCAARDEVFAQPVYYIFDQGDCDYGSSAGSEGECSTRSTC